MRQYFELKIVEDENRIFFDLLFEPSPFEQKVVLLASASALDFDSFRSEVQTMMRELRAVISEGEEALSMHKARKLQLRQDKEILP